MKHATLSPGRYVFEQPFEYVPPARHEATLRVLHQYSDTIEAQKERIRQLEQQLQSEISGGSNDRRT